MGKLCPGSRNGLQQLPTLCSGGWGGRVYEFNGNSVDILLFRKPV